MTGRCKTWIIMLKRTPSARALTEVKCRRYNDYNVNQWISRTYAVYNRGDADDTKRHKSCPVQGPHRTGGATAAANVDDAVLRNSVQPAARS